MCKITKEMLKELDLVSMIDMKIEIDGEINDVRTQIDYAKSNAAAYKEYSNIEWYNSAKSALRIKGMQSQMLQVEIGRRNKTSSIG